MLVVNGLPSFNINRSGHFNLSLFLNYKRAILAYFILFFSLAFPFFLGNVVAPHRQHNDIRAVETHKGSELKENPKFSDCNHFYIPEITQNLKGTRSGWLALWTNSNELGRPIYKLSGFAQTYFPSWILSKIIDNPWRFYTIICLFNCFFAGIFILLFCREVNLSPIAGLIAGMSLATAPYLMYWLTFPMYTAVWCWSSGILWGITRMARRTDLLSWSILAFSSYSLLMTAFPQTVVFHAYILTGYGLYLVYKKQKSGWFEASRFCAFSLSALIVGAILAAPVYIDLMHTASESARVGCDPSFFTEVLPKISTLKEAVGFFVLSTSPQFFGDPIMPDYTFYCIFEGFGITPLMIFFSLIGLLSRFKETWAWWLAIAILFMLTFVQPFYIVMIKYFGLNLSRCIPINIILLPLIIIVAYGVDALAKRSIGDELSLVVLMATAGVMGVLVIGVGYGLNQGIEIRWYMVLFMVILLALFLAQYKKTHLLLLITALIIVMATISYPLILHQNPSKIAMTSPLVEKIQANLPKSSRYALIAPNLSILSPNLNSMFGLDSIHSYNSLSSRRYHLLINALGGKMIAYGRHNYVISPDYNSAMFWMSNVGLVLSPNTLSNQNLEYLGEESGYHFYKVISRMGESLQIIPLQTQTLNSENLEVEDIWLLKTYTPFKELDQGDFLDFKVMSGLPSILILSQKFHRDWQAQVRVKSGWIPAKTITINGVFQGIVLPKDVYQVRLEFKQFASYTWVGHIFWFFLLIFLVFSILQKNKLIHTGQKNER